MRGRVHGALVCDIGMGEQGAIALAEALGSGACPSLRAFSLTAQEIGDQGVRRLVEAMEADARPKRLICSFAGSGWVQRGHKTSRGRWKAARAKGSSR